MRKALLAFVLVAWLGAAPAHAVSAPSQAEPRPGCSANAVVRLDLSQQGLVIDGKPIASLDFRARDGCDDLDRPLVAFNWFTLNGWWATLRMRQYQIYAVTKVSADAQAKSVVFNARHPTVLRQPDGVGPAAGAAWRQPWVHDEATMPFYLSAKALLHMLDVNRADYFDELRVKREAIGESGYFGFQACLANCTELAAPTDAWHPLLALLRPKLRPPLLVHHMNVGRAQLERFLSAIQAELIAEGTVRLAYAGWTVADPVMVAQDGSLVAPLQKPL